jgi:hypothetical protein
MNQGKRTVRRITETEPGVKVKRMLMGSTILSYERLEEIEAALARGAPVRGALRLELRQLVARVLLLTGAKRGRGHPVDQELLLRVKIAMVLKRDHGVPVARTAAELGGARWSVSDFQKAYRRFRDSDSKLFVSDRLVRQVLASIDSKRK